jgi:hypothetical protein
VTSPAGSVPRRYEIGERFNLSAAAVPGTVIVRVARPYGFGAQFATDTPCCRHGARINAIDATYRGHGDPASAGVFKTCPGCGWKWTVRLALNGRQLDQLPADAGHPRIGANQAEWISRGSGTRPYRRRTR